MPLGACCSPSELCLGDRREGELAGTDRPERAESRRQQETGSVGERIDVGATGDGARSRGGSDGQAKADSGHEQDSS
jgi:hypothetical protein